MYYITDDGTYHVRLRYIQKAQSAEIDRYVDFSPRFNMPAQSRESVYEVRIHLGSRAYEV